MAENNSRICDEYLATVINYVFQVDWTYWYHKRLTNASTPHLQLCINIPLSIILFNICRVYWNIRYVFNWNAFDITFVHITSFINQSMKWIQNLYWQRWNCEKAGPSRGFVSSLFGKLHNVSAAILLGLLTGISANYQSTRTYRMSRFINVPMHVLEAKHAGHCPTTTLDVTASS